MKAHCVVHHDVPGSPWKSWPTCSSTKTMRPCSQRLTIGLGSSLAAATKMVRPFWYQQMKDKKVSSDSMSAAQSAYMFVHWIFSLWCAILQAIHGPKMECMFETIIASTSLEMYGGHRYFVIKFTNGWLQWHLHCSGVFQSLIVS